MDYFKKEGEADKQAVKKLTKEVSKQIAGQVKKAMKEQDICSGCTNVKGCVTCVNGNMKELTVEDVLEQGKRFGRTNMKVIDALEQEMNDYYYKNYAYITSQADTKEIVAHIARHFAEWQKERDHDACRTCEKREKQIIYDTTHKGHTDNGKE